MTSISSIRREVVFSKQGLSTRNNSINADVNFLNVPQIRTMKNAEPNTQQSFSRMFKSFDAKMTQSDMSSGKWIVDEDILKKVATPQLNPGNTSKWILDEDILKKVATP